MIPEMDVITELAPDQKMDQLREMLRAKMLEKGGGVQPQSHRSVAREIGLSQPSLSLFLARNRSDIEPGTAIRIAKYLGVSPVTVLRMAGHDELAKILGDLIGLQASEEDEQIPNPWVEQFAKAIDDLDTDSRDAVLRNARNVARVLREAQQRYPTTIGEPPDEPESPKKRKAPARPYHAPTKKRK